MDSLFSGIYTLTLTEVQPLVLLFDVLFRSMLAVLAFRWWADSRRPALPAASTCRGLLLLLICVAALPFLPALTELFPALIPAQFAMTSLVTVLIPASLVEPIVAEHDQPQLMALLLRTYAIGVLLGVCFIAHSILRLSTLKANACLDVQNQDSALLDAAKESLGYRGQVTLGLSSSVGSPVSFGCRQPTILVPVAWLEWQQAIRLSVLKHELAHIQRRDWLTAILANIVVCFSWYNPFVWHLRGRIIIETEYASDAAVLSQSTCKYAYAEHLLWVAKNIKQAAGKGIHTANPMVAVTNLTERVNRVLADREAGQQAAIPFRLNTVLIAAALLLLTCTRVFSAQDAALYQSPKLIVTPSPLNSTFYLWQGMSGYAHVRFDVDERGAVNADSIRILNPTRSELFSEAVVETVKQFKYQPRLVNGIAMPSKDMEWMFRIKGFMASLESK